MNWGRWKDWAGELPQKAGSSPLPWSHWCWPSGSSHIRGSAWSWPLGNALFHGLLRWRWVMGEDLLSTWLGHSASPTLPVPDFYPVWLPYNYKISPEGCTAFLPSLLSLLLPKYLLVLVSLRPQRLFFTLHLAYRVWELFKETVVTVKCFQVGQWADGCGQVRRTIIHHMQFFQILENMCA